MVRGPQFKHPVTVTSWFTTLSVDTPAAGLLAVIVTLLPVPTWEKARIVVALAAVVPIVRAAAITIGNALPSIIFCFIFMVLSS